MVMGIWRVKVRETEMWRRYLGLPCPLRFHEDGSATNGCGVKGTRVWRLGDKKVGVAGGHSYGVLWGTWGWTCSAGGVLLAMRNTDFFTVFSKSGCSFSLFFLFPFLSAVKSSVGMLLWRVGSWETERCWSGCGLEVFGIRDA